MRRLFSISLIATATTTLGMCLAVAGSASGKQKPQATMQPGHPVVGELPPLPATAAPPAHGAAASDTFQDGSVGFLGKTRLSSRAHSPFTLKDFGARQAKDYFLAQYAKRPHASGKSESNRVPVELALTATDGLPGHETAAYFVQTWQGVPIEGTFALAVMRDDDLRYARHFFVASPNIDVIPSPFAAAAAQAAAVAYMQTRSGRATLVHEGLPSGAFEAADVPAVRPAVLKQPELVIIYRPETPNASPSIADEGMPVVVWSIDIDTERPWERRTVYIDAQLGTPVATRKRSHDAPVGAAGHVSFEVEPQCYGDTPLTLPMPYVRLNGVSTTDAMGRFDLESSATQLLVTLDSPYIHLINHNGRLAGPWSYPLRRGGHNDIAIDDPALDQIDPLFYIHQVRAWVRSRVPHSNTQTQWTDERLDVHLNMDDTCNAYYDGSLHFFAAGDGCLNTGRVANLVYHEYAHGIHAHSAPGTAQLSPDPQVSEGIADFVAATITGNPNMRGLYGCEDSFRSCVNTLSYCEGGQCDFNAHSEAHGAGQVLCGAWWDLRNRLIGRYGNAQGVALCDRLHLKFLTLVGNMHSAYQATIAADDDDDADPSNGTRHSCEINAAFLEAAPGEVPRFPGQPVRVACVPYATVH